MNVLIRTKHHEEAVKLCLYLEPRLREKGWHVALTGSALYGRTRDNGKPPDIDLIFYPHNDDKEHPEDGGELLSHCGIKEFKMLGNSEYRDERTEDWREIWRTHTKSGRQVDIMFL